MTRFLYVVASFSLFAFLSCSGQAFAMSEYFDAMRGNSEYKHGHFEKAASCFAEAESRKAGWDVPEFNRGNSLYRMEKYDEAVEEYGKVAENESSRLGSEALYNMGNSFFKRWS